jgi:hypothetical protein
VIAEDDVEMKPTYYFLLTLQLPNQRRMAAAIYEYPVGSRRAVTNLPRFNSGIFLLMESFWHVKAGWGEMDDTIYPFLLANPKFPRVFRSVVSGCLTWRQTGTTVAGWYS